MPTISVTQSDFIRYYGKALQRKDFEELCFAFGIEVDEISEDADPLYKLEVGANRYDLLSAFGICNALRLFTRRGSILSKIVPLNLKCKLEIDHISLDNIRPVIVACIVKNVDLQTKNNLSNLINLQEKIHQNLGRKRTLVSIGLHDYSKILNNNENFSIIYTAVNPEQLEFPPLGLDHCLHGKEQLEDYYKQSNHLKPYYYSILQNYSKWPVVMNNLREVLSQPPLINSNKTIVTEFTKDILIEITGTDLHRCKLALISLIHQIPSIDGSLYCYHLTDNNFTDRQFYESIDDLSAALPAKQRPDTSQLLDMLTRMGYTDCFCSHIEKTRPYISFKSPIYRVDVLHLCDVQEDVCIAFGYQNINNDLSAIRFTEGKQLAIERLCTDCRNELARCGYFEALNFVLCSRDEINANNNPVIVANAVSSQCTAIRQVLWCGLVKTLAGNQHLPLPIKLFEIGDIIKSANEENQCRHAGWLFAGKRSGFEDVLGTLDRIFLMLSINIKLEPTKHCPEWIPNRVANIVDSRHNLIYGYIGVLNPDLMNTLFKIQMPCTICEIDLNVVLSRL